MRVKAFRRKNGSVVKSYIKNYIRGNKYKLNRAKEKAKLGLNITSVLAKTGLYTSYEASLDRILKGDKSENE